MIYIIGCGGVGSWLTPSICMLKGARRVTVIDGDLLEEKNLNRQLYTVGEVGEKKSDALAARTGCLSIPHFYHAGTVNHTAEDWLLCCVDNNAARIAALNACDTYGCQAILGANETHSAEAYYYRPQWKDTPRDPRVYYPELLIDRGRDPLGCTGQAQDEKPQLVSANFMAAALMQHLLVLWCDHGPQFTEQTIALTSHHMTASLSKLDSKQPDVWVQEQPLFVEADYTAERDYQ